MASHRQTLCLDAINATQANDVVQTLYASALATFEHSKDKLGGDEVDVWLSRIERAFRSALRRAELAAIAADAALEAFDTQEHSTQEATVEPLVFEKHTPQPHVREPRDIGFLRGMSLYGHMLVDDEVSCLLAISASDLPFRTKILSRRLFDQVDQGNIINVELLLWFRKCGGAFAFAIESDGQDEDFGEDLLLVHAVKKSQTEIVCALLADGRANPASFDSDSLRMAAQRGNIVIVRQLLADGRADPTASESTALRSAALNEYADIVRALLVDGRADPHNNRYPYTAGAVGESAYGTLDLGRFGYYSALTLAIQGERKSYASLKALLEDTRVDPCRFSTSCITAIMQSCQYGMIRVLVEDGRFNFNQHLMLVPRTNRMAFRFMLEDTKHEKFMSDSFYDAWSWTD